MRKWIENMMTCHLNRDMESQTGSTLVSASAQQKCLLTTAVSYSKYGKKKFKVCLSLSSSLSTGNPIIIMSFFIFRQ